MGLKSVALHTVLLIFDVVGNRSSDIEAKVERHLALFIHTGSIMRSDLNLLPLHNSKLFMLLPLPIDALETIDCKPFPFPIASIANKNRKQEQSV